MKKFALAAAVAGLASAFAHVAVAKDGWMGAEAEKAYDKQLAAKRMSEVLNNDDYYEIHAEDRIYAFSDQKEYKLWQETGEVPLAVTKIAAGPNGETIKLQLNKRESKAMEKTVGYKGAAQKLFEGEMEGAEAGFYGEVVTAERLWVFDDWSSMKSFRTTGEAACGITQVGAGPDGRTVVFVQACKVAAKGKPEMAMARFAANYAKK